VHVDRLAESAGTIKSARSRILAPHASAIRDSHQRIKAIPSERESMSRILNSTRSARVKRRSSSTDSRSRSRQKHPLAGSPDPDSSPRATLARPSRRSGGSTYRRSSAGRWPAVLIGECPGKLRKWKEKRDTRRKTHARMCPAVERGGSTCCCREHAEKARDILVSVGRTRQQRLFRLLPGARGPHRISRHHGETAHHGTLTSTKRETRGRAGDCSF